MPDDFRNIESHGAIPELTSPIAPLVEHDGESEERRRSQSEPQQPQVEAFRPSQFSIFERLDFLWRTHSFIGNNIRLADTKAAVTIVVASSIVASLHSAGLHAPLATLPFGVWSAREWLVGFSFLTLGLSILLSAWSVQPRFWRTQDVDHVFWVNILVYPSADRFWESFHRETPEALERNLARNIFALASVCKRKFGYVRSAMWIAIVGGLAATSLLLLK